MGWWLMAKIHYRSTIYRKSLTQYSFSVELNVLFPIKICASSFAKSEVNVLSDERQECRWISKGQYKQNDASQFI